MLGEYFSNIDRQVSRISDLGNQTGLLRRDVNDLHSIIMLRSAGEKIPKKNRLVFIGTGQINENVFHAYIQFRKALENRTIKFDGDSFFVARSELEYKLLNKYGYPVYHWKYQPTLALKLLESKAVVLSSHLYSMWGDNLLSHCVASAIKIELWHGLPAKNIAASCIGDEMEFHFFTRILEDSVNTQHVCIQYNSPDVVAEYSTAFPYAKQHATGDCRTDIFFDENYRQQFLSYKESSHVSDWLKRNSGVKKVLYAPTYRESPETIEEHYQKMIDFLRNANSPNVKLAVKLHVGIVLTAERLNELKRVCAENGNLFIEYFDEVYSVFNDFDAIIVDYSSIRSDFALTGKPIFLWRFDEHLYRRKQDVVLAFTELDKVSYKLESIISLDMIAQTLSDDPLKDKRLKTVQKEFGKTFDGKAGVRTIQVLLDVMNNKY